MVFGRSDKPFFSLGEVKLALRQFADAENLVIYCGAGVTIDHTGLGWETMLARAFDADDSLLEVMRPFAGFTQVATAFSSDSGDGNQAESGYEWQVVAERLRDYLYPGKGVRWEIGGMLDSLTNLALVTATLGKSVTVISTNYDDHLKDSLDEEAARAGGETPVEVFSELGDFEYPAFKSGAVQFYYLHGRIPECGSPSKHRVINELDYAQSRGQSVDFMRSVFAAERTALLILGSSISDPPLVDALALTRGQSGPRWALFALEPSHIHENSRCEAILQRLTVRARLLGLQLLIPDFVYQIPQFLTELAQVSGHKAGAEDFLASDLRYGRRLGRWWDAFGEDNTGESLYLKVRDTYGALLAYLRPDDSERLRLDLWLREAPSERQLTLMATTAGPFTDERLFKRRPIMLGTRNATIRSFVAGRPSLLDLEVLGAADAEARWKTFMVVPIQERVDLILTPVGAVTLSSDRLHSESCLSTISHEDRSQVLALLGAVLVPTEGDPT